MSHCRISSHNSHSIPWIVISRLIGLVIYLIIVIVLMGIRSNNAVIGPIITFLTSPAIIALVVVFSLLFLVGEVFFALDFPLNIPGPFFNAIGSVFLVSFLFQLLYLVDRLSDIPIFTLFRPLEPLLYFLVFIIVLIVQYVHLFTHGWWEGREISSSPESKKETSDKEPSSPAAHSDVSWGEVEGEFRMFLYDFFHSLRDALKKK